MRSDFSLKIDEAVQTEKKIQTAPMVVARYYDQAIFPRSEGWPVKKSYQSSPL